MSECRDRLGLWGTAAVDSEVAGNISGLERLRLSRFNKVSALKPIILQYSIFRSTGSDRVRVWVFLFCFLFENMSEMVRERKKWMKESRLKQG